MVPTALQTSIAPTTLPNAASTSVRHHQIVIVGGGAAGITVASQLLRSDRTLDIVIIEPSDKHYYQAGLTLVGGGLAPIQRFVRDEKDVLPQGCQWIQSAVTTLDPEHNAVITATGVRIEYDYLVLCPGLQLDWHQIKGLNEALGQGGVTSNYAKEHASYTWETIQNFRGGTALFTHPNTPIKCGGAPQKVMYMADDHFKSKSGVGVNTKVMFCTAGEKLFTVPAYNTSLEKVVQRREIITNFRHNLKEIKAETQEALFDVTTDKGVTEITIRYDILHVAPPMSPPDFIKGSEIANNAGWVEVNQYTLQQVRYANIFALGDVSSLPTSKTAAAARKQAPVVVQNLLSLMKDEPLAAQYNGYTCCPLITGYHSAIMAEFDYAGKPASSFPFDPTQERYSMFLAKTYALPWLYWNRMLKGAGFEADLFKPINHLVHR